MLLVVGATVVIEVSVTWYGWRALTGVLGGRGFRLSLEPIPADSAALLATP